MTRPAGIAAAAARERLFKEFNLEIGAGRMWRFAWRRWGRCWRPQRH